MPLHRGNPSDRCWLRAIARSWTSVVPGRHVVCQSVTDASHCPPSLSARRTPATGRHHARLQPGHIESAVVAGPIRDRNPSHRAGIQWHAVLSAGILKIVLASPSRASGDRDAVQVTSPISGTASEAAPPWRFLAPGEAPVDRSGPRLTSVVRFPELELPSPHGTHRRACPSWASTGVAPWLPS